MFIIPITHEETLVRRMPGVTLSIAALCILVMLLTPSDPGAFYRTWGLIPTELSALTSISHIFVHGGWLHLVGNFLMLYLAGPPIEDRFGRPLFAAFYAVAGVFAGLFYCVLSAESTLPLVGASGAIAAVMGACLVRFGRAKIRFYYAFFTLRVHHGTFWAPTWMMLPVWFGIQLLEAGLTESAGEASGIAYWAHIGGFGFGVSFALAMRTWNVEERFIHSAIERKITVVTNPLIDEAMQARKTGDVEGAYLLLHEAAGEHPEDPEIICALWEVTCELQRPGDAAPAMQQLVHSTLSAGAGEQAARYWLEIVDRAPDSRAEPGVLVRLVPVLEAMEKRSAIECALLHCVDAKQAPLSIGLALRVMDLAKDVAPSVSLCAARRALESSELHLGKRGRIEAWVKELESRGVCAEASRGSTTPDRALSVDLAETPDRSAPTAPSVELPPMPVATPPPLPNAPAASPPPQRTVQVIAAASEESVPRFSGLKFIEAVPVAFGEFELTLRQPDGSPSRVEFDGIDAVSCAAVEGLAPKPVLIVDLMTNWTELSEGPLCLVRLRSDRFAVAELFPEAGGSIAAFRKMLDQLLYRSAAVQLPDPEGARGRPFRHFSNLETYQRQVLNVG